MTDLERDLKELRGYGLGCRNPDTQPLKYSNSETPDNNRRQSSYWTSVRKWIASANSVGAKY